MTHVLIADDHPLFRAALVQAVRGLGVGTEVHEAGSLGDALMCWCHDQLGATIVSCLPQASSFESNTVRPAPCTQKWIALDVRRVFSPTKPGGSNCARQLKVDRTEPPVSGLRYSSMTPSTGEIAGSLRLAADFRLCSVSFHG